MSVMTQLSTRPEHLKGATHRSEARRYKRYDLPLLGRFLRVLTREEFTCQLIDISVGGASLLTDAEIQVGETIVMYFDELGGLEGEVLRTVAGALHGWTPPPWLDLWARKPRPDEGNGPTGTEPSGA